MSTPDAQPQIAQPHSGTSTTTIGGDSLFGGFTVTDAYGNPVVSTPSTTTIGGDDLLGGFTVTDAYGNPVVSMPTTTTIGGDDGGLDGGGLVDSLMELYALAPPGGLEQATILEILDSQSDMADIWLTDTTADRDGDGTPDYRDSSW